MALIYALIYAGLCAFGITQTPYDWIIFFAILCAPGLSKYYQHRKDGSYTEVCIWAEIMIPHI